MTNRTAQRIATNHIANLSAEIDYRMRCIRDLQGASLPIPAEVHEAYEEAVRAYRVAF